MRMTETWGKNMTSFIFNTQKYEGKIFFSVFKHLEERIMGKMTYM